MTAYARRPLGAVDEHAKGASRNYWYEASVRMTRRATTTTSSRRTAPTSVISDYAL
jgi:hypothetical protein